MVSCAGGLRAPRARYAAGFRAAFVFVLESDKAHQVWSDGEVSAVIQRIAIVGELRLLGECAREVEQCLAVCRKAIGTGDGDGIAKIGAVAEPVVVRDQRAGGLP